MFAKLIDNAFTPAPRRIVRGSEQVFNPTDEMLAALGFKPVLFTEPPETPEGYYPENGWTETDGAIVQTWTLCAVPQGAGSAD